MSVLIEAYNVVIQRDTLTRKYPGGRKQYGQDCPNLTYCYDDHLTRIGFMAFDDASAFANRLLQDYHLDALEIAIVVQDRGLLAPSRLLKNAFRDPHGRKARKRIAQNRPINDDLPPSDHFLSLRREARRVSKPFFSNLLENGSNTRSIETAGPCAG